MSPRKFIQYKARDGLMIPAYVTVPRGSSGKNLPLIVHIHGGPWVRGFYDATAPHSEAGGYVNFMAGDDQERIKDNYKGNYDRLVDVKRTYDPDNLFRHNQNIRP